MTTARGALGVDGKVQVVVIWFVAILNIALIERCQLRMGQRAQRCLVTNVNLQDIQQLHYSPFEPSGLLQGGTLLRVQCRS